MRLKEEDLVRMMRDNPDLVAAQLQGETSAAKAIRKSRASELEDMFDSIWFDLGYGDIVWEKNYKGWCSEHPKWEFDRAYPKAMVYVEIHGGIWLRKGGHNTGTGIERDYLKQNTAIVLGWTPFVLTTGLMRGPEIAAWLVRIRNAIGINLQMEKEDVWNRGR